MNKITEAFELFKSNIKLFSAIVLTVWLPGALICSYFDFYVFPEWANGNEMSFVKYSNRLSSTIEFIVRPIYVGGLFYGAFQLQEGLTVNYQQVITYAIRKSFKMFWASLTTALIIAGGTLLFIIPGVILALRFTLVEAIVVLEGTSASQARQRSTQLTKGRRWRIAGVTLLSCFIASLTALVVSAAIYIPLGLVGLGENFIVHVVITVLANIISSIPYLVIFLFYWEGADQTQKTPAIKVRRYL